MVFGVNDVTITNTGFVGVNQPSPLSQLHVGGGVRASTGLPGSLQLSSSSNFGYSFGSNGNTGLVGFSHLHTHVAHPVSFVAMH